MKPYRLLALLLSFSLFFSLAIGQETGEKEKDDPKTLLPQVLLKTSKGDVVIELFEDEAPNTVANFISLVEKEFYDGVLFHRVLKDFMAQTGDPTGRGSGGPGYTIKCECYQEKARKHKQAGTVAMAHAGKDTGGSQFYITYRPTPHLDGPDYFHTVFGRVIKGMDVVEDLNKYDGPRTPRIEPDKIVEAKVLKKRDHEYKPKVVRDKDRRR